jgi:hypothetical protein
MDIPNALLNKQNIPTTTESLTSEMNIIDTEAEKTKRIWINCLERKLRETSDFSIPED